MGGFYEEENEGQLGRDASLTSYGIQYYMPATNYWSCSFYMLVV